MTAHMREADSVDVAKASDQLDALLDERVAGREEATAAEMAWKASVRRYNAKLGRENRAAWYAFYSRLVASLKASAERYERRAEALCEENERKDKSS